MDREAPQPEHLSLGVHPRILQPATFPPFPLYIQDESDGGFRLFRPADEPVYVSTWRKLEQAGAERLFVRAEDRNKCLDYVEDNLPGLLKEDPLPEGQLAQWVYVLAVRAMEDLLGDPDGRGNHERLRQIVGTLVSVMEQDRSALWHILETAPLNYYTHAHCVNVSVLLTGCARRMLGVTDTDVLTEVAMGGALHDLGKVMVPEEILAKPAGLTRGEFAKVSQHPRHGLEIARPFLRREALAQRVIVQHHENASGGGYPDGRSGPAINSFARAARLADVFDALTSHRPYGGALDPYRALNTMASEMPGVFDRGLLRRFIRYAADAFEQDSPIELPSEALSREQRPSAEQESRSAPPPAITYGPGIAAEGPEEPAATGPTPPAPSAEEEDAVPQLRRRIDAIRELSERQDENIAMMTGILGALREAVRGRLRQAEVEEQQEQKVAPSVLGRSARQAHVDAVRPLFPLVWEVDEWTNRLSPRAHQAGEEVDLRREFLDCLHGLRERMVRILHSHQVELIERTDTSEAGHLERVGFLYRDEATAEVIEPARVIIRRERRKAG
ncbi:MAG: HD domain-containing protein [Candidatus Brocadiaceae bacterium]|jgi:hypothetical protein